MIDIKMVKNSFDIKIVKNSFDLVIKFTKKLKEVSKLFIVHTIVYVGVCLIPLLRTTMHVPKILYHPILSLI